MPVLPLIEKTYFEPAGHLKSVTERRQEYPPTAMGPNPTEPKSVAERMFNMNEVLRNEKTSKLNFRESERQVGRENGVIATAMRSSMDRFSNMGDISARAKTPGANGGLPFEEDASVACPTISPFESSWTKPQTHNWMRGTVSTDIPQPPAPVPESELIEPELEDHQRNSLLYPSLRSSNFKERQEAVSAEERLIRKTQSRMLNAKVQTSTAP
jgi:hypothetical protein